MILRKSVLAVVPLMVCTAVTLPQDTPASKPSTRPADAQGLNSLAAIQEHFNNLQEESQKAIEKQRLAAVEAFLPKAPADEREDVLGTLVGLSLRLESYAKSLAFAEQFLKEFPKSENVNGVRKMRVMDLNQLQRLPEARQEWEAMLKQVRMEDYSDMFQLGLQLAEKFTGLDDVKSAREVYLAIRDRLPESVPANQRPMAAQQLEREVSPRLAGLDLIGQIPSALQGKTLSGDTVDLARYKGKVVLLDFWATWCRPCVAAVPTVKEVYHKYHDRGLEIVGISLDVEERPLKEFVQQQGLAWPQVWDNQSQPGTRNQFGGPNSRRYNLTSIPATFLLDRDGQIIRVNVPAAGLDEAVSRALARPATQPAGSAAGAATRPGTKP
jgi:peroxiredoxin